MVQDQLFNLILNAREAIGSAPGQITVRASWRQDRLFLTATDSGPGFSSASLERAFDPFFTTKTTGKGLGLGLSISYNIVVDFGGHLSARNNADGPGASFTIELKRTDSPDQANLAAE